MRVTRASAVVVATALVLAGARTAVANTALPTVTVRADQVLTDVARGSIGVNTPIWNGHLMDPVVPELIRRAGLGELEFNGGGVSDLYHWRDGSLSADPEADQHDVDYSALPVQFSFDAFERVARQTGATTLVHVNYGTGTPAEAAAWVRYANVVRHDHVRDWTIGEEVYLNGAIPGIDVEPDAHQDKSPAAYGRGVVAYAKAMKAVDPSVRIGIELAPPIPGSPMLDWDKAVLATAGHAADFVDLHWYPYTAKNFFDTVRQVPAIMSETRTLVNQTAGPKTRIVVGETNSAVAASEQESSVTNAVFLADDELTLLENGASTVDWWALHNGTTTTSVPDDFDLALLSSGGSRSSGPGPEPTDIPFAPYYGQELTSALATPGSTLVETTGANGPVFTHAARQRNGNLIVLLLNEDATTAHQINLQVTGYKPSPTTQRESLAGAGTGITRSAGPATGPQTLPANSLTELVLHPAH